MVALRLNHDAGLLMAAHRCRLCLLQAAPPPEPGGNCRGGPPPTAAHPALALTRSPAATALQPLEGVRARAGEEFDKAEACFKVGGGGSTQKAAGRGACCGGGACCWRGAVGREDLRCAGAFC